MPQAPSQPKIYHILHVDRLASVIADGFLWCDAKMVKRSSTGTPIGISRIKERRLRMELDCHPGLHVGDCVPFYFCPRSIMLYVLYCNNHVDLTYRGGQRPIVHLEADLQESVNWTNQNGKRWAFTLSNAGAGYFEDRGDLGQLNEIDWSAVHAEKWAGPGIASEVKEGKQAEFLVEERFPWKLVERIGVLAPGVVQQALDALPSTGRRPKVEVKSDWYY